MHLWSEAFADGEQIPIAYTRDGGNASPPLRWADLPDGTRELALLFESITPGAQEPRAKWLLYKIPPDADGLPEDLGHGRDPDEPGPALHGTNAEGNVGYDGPLGTINRTFRYRFRLLALDRELDVPYGLDRAALLAAVEGHVLGEAELVVRHDRPG